MIYDCFLFNNELDLLKIRCEELKGLVKHVIIESCYTFSGNQKPLHFYENREMFKDYDIMYLCELQHIGKEAWDMESHSRNRLDFGLFKNGDIIILSDVDEIPMRNKVLEYKSEMGVSALVMDKYGYYLNCLEGKQSWTIAKMFTYPVTLNGKNRTFDEIRNGGQNTFINNAGHHFSWCGDADYIIDKFKSFSHQELNNEQNTDINRIKRKMETLESLWSDEELDKWQLVRIDESFPKYLYENQSEFQHLIK